MAPLAQPRAWPWIYHDVPPSSINLFDFHYEDHHWIVRLSSNQTTCRTSDVAITWTLRQLIGKNLRRLRQEVGLTQVETVRLLRLHGLLWSREKLSAVEQGNRPVPVEDAIVLCIAFNITLAELMSGGEAVTLNDQTTLNTTAAQDVLNGRHVREEIRAGGPQSRGRKLLKLAESDTRFAAFLDSDATEVDEEVSRRIGLPLKTVTEIAVLLWGRTTTAERDAQVNDLGDLPLPERQARRGHITRKLSREIEKEALRRHEIGDRRSKDQDH